MSSKLNVKSERKEHLELRRKSIALKAARILKGLSRHEAARLCNCTSNSFEQIENCRIGFTDDRLRVLLNGIGYRWGDFQTLLKDPNLHLRRALEKQPIPEISTKPRRNTFKVISKEVRVLKILRTRKGISQCKASKLCGYPRCTFGQIEHGRIELPVNRISRILDALDIPQADFVVLMKADALKDEILADCCKSLALLDDEKLDSVQLIIKSFLKSRGE